MNILHFATIKKDALNGVSVAVPAHVVAQQKVENVAFVNVLNDRVEQIDRQFEFCNNFTLENLPKPFNLPDLVVFHEVYRFQYLGISKELHKKRIPYIIVPHGELSKTAQRKKWFKKKLANLLLFNKFILKATALQCLSQGEYDNVNFKTRKFIATNGMNLPDKRKEKFSVEGIKFVYIGRLEIKIKGLDLLLEAVKKIKGPLIEKGIKIYIYGPNINNYREKTQHLVLEKGVEKIVEIGKEISGKEKEQVLLASDIFIQTSRSEGMPMGILEALSYGLPCLVTKGTRLAEMVQKNAAGWGCATTVEEIARAILEAIENKETYPQKSLAAIKTIEENFLWENLAKETLATYKSFFVESGEKNG